MAVKKIIYILEGGEKLKKLKKKGGTVDDSDDMIIENELMNKNISLKLGKRR